MNSRRIRTEISIEASQSGRRVEFLWCLAVSKFVIKQDNFAWICRDVKVLNGVEYTVSLAHTEKPYSPVSDHQSLTT